MFQLFSAKRRRAGRRDWSVLPLESRILPSAIQVFSTNGPGGSVNLRLEGTSANEVVFVEPDAAVPGRVSFLGLYEGFSLNGGPVQFTLSFPAVNNIKVNLQAGDDQFFLSNVSVNDITIEDGTSSTETGVYVINSFGTDMSIGDVEAEFGQGNMLIQIGAGDIALPHSLTVNSLEVEAENTSALNVTLLSGAAALYISEGVSVDSEGSFSVDTIEIRVSTFNAPGSITVDGGLSLELAGGNDGVYIQGTTIAINGRTEIETGAGDDFVEFNFGFGSYPGAFKLNGKVEIDTGSGKDWVRIVDFSLMHQIEVTGAVSIETGSQNDLVQIFGAKFNNKFELDLGNSSSDPSPISGAAADVLSLGNTDIFGVAQIESDGQANVFVFAANSALQPMRFRSNAFFTLGSGFVDMSFVFDTSQVIFDKQQVFRGITSTIMVKYGSSVVFNPQRRRLVNAVLT